MKYPIEHRRAIRYRGFILIEQGNHSWKVQPERSPILLMPFRTRSCSLAEVKAILDFKLSTKEFMLNVA